MENLTGTVIKLWGPVFKVSMSLFLNLGVFCGVRVQSVNSYHLGYGRDLEKKQRQFDLMPSQTNDGKYEQLL